jgi:cytochrome c oxidase subunit IV
MEPQETAIPAQPDDVLKRYDIVMKYLATEGQIFWNRSQLFLVANAALIGFIFREVPSSLRETSATKLTILFAGTLTGALLCGLWFRAIRSGNKWLDHWLAILRTWEQEAMGDTNLFRRSPAGPSSRGVAKLTASLFLVIWVLLAVYTAVCFLLKINGIGLP